MIEIDGSHGEGGGQVLRTSLSLSTLFQKPFRIYNIRRGRKKPGLMPQHRMCIQALEKISNARVVGNIKGSSEVVFEPSTIQAGKYLFDIGTAGSTSLLLQAILPPLLFAQGTSSLTLRGGTHVPFSPPFHYISEAFFPMLAKLGVRTTARIESYGFYPKGGGKIHVTITPVREIQNITLSERGESMSLQGISGVGNLPISIAERQREAASQLLRTHGLSARIETLSVPTPGQGTFLFLKQETQACIAGFSSLGERGKRAETVGEEAAQHFLDYYSSSACLDLHLADQIVLYLTMKRGVFSFAVSQISDHLLTNLWVIDKFIHIDYTIDGLRGSPGKITVKRT